MIALYARVSTTEQATDKHFSIPEQIEKMKAYCKMNGWKNYKTFVDGGYTGGNLNRPAMQDLIKQVEKGKITCVLSYKLDRLSRSQKDTLYLVEDVFLKNNCNYISITESFDSSTAIGKAMLGFLSVFSQLEKERIKERMALGKEGRTKQGLYNGGRIPFGYTYKDGVFSVNEYEAMQIKEAVEMFLNGHTMAEITRIFDSKGYILKSAKWSRDTLARLFTKPFQCGYICKNDGRIIKGKHPAIYPIEEWEKANFIYKNKCFKKENHLSLLSGLIACGVCGSKYAIRHGANGRSYTCYKRMASYRERKGITEKCKNKNYRTDKLEKIIVEEIKKLSFAPLVLDNLLEDSEQEKEKIKVLEKQIKTISIKCDRLLDLYADASISKETYTRKIKPLEEEKEKLALQLEALNARKPQKEEIKKKVLEFPDIYEKATEEEKRLLVSALISKIVINGGDIDIIWNF